MIRRDFLPTYCKIAKDIEKEFRVTWEFTLNENIIFSNTNSYLSIIDESFMLDDELNWINHKVSKKVKRKGMVFRHGDDIPLGDGTNEQIIAKALEQYFVNGVDPEEYIRNPEKYGNSIFDYCCSKKINKQFEVYLGDEKVQNLNRYYFSKVGYYLMKKRKNSSENKMHLHKGQGVKLLNNYNPDVSFEKYRIDYQYYVVKTKKLIDEMEWTLTHPTLF